MNFQNDSPENQKQKLKLRAEEFEMDMKKSQRKHTKKPRIIGCVWLNSFGMDDERFKILHCFAAIVLDGTPVGTTFTKIGANQDVNTSPTMTAVGEDGTPKARSGYVTKKAVPEEGT